MKLVDDQMIYSSWERITVEINGVQTDIQVAKDQKRNDSIGLDCNMTINEMFRKKWINWEISDWKRFMWI